MDLFEQIRRLLSSLLQRSSDQLFKCEVCGISFNSLCSLTTHRRTHTAEKPFPDSLTIGRRPYAREDPYKCDVHGARLSRNGGLTKHHRTHAAERPYKCDVCDTAFAKNSQLTRHRRTHTGEKPYKCDVCGKTFTRKCNMSMHLRTHATGGHATVRKKE